MQVPEVNYNCRLRSETLAANGQTRGDTDIGLLVACKVQLSSEVIRWKTESLRLQKECDNAHHQSKELDQQVSKLLEEKKDLKTRLSQAEEENKYLKMKNVRKNDEKMNSMQKLTQSLNKYHSFPTIDKAVVTSGASSVLEIPEPQKPEDWREVSQRMIKQMKQEMKELQSMNLNVPFYDIESNVESTCIDSDCQGALEDNISALVSDAKSLKHQLFQQRKKLNSLYRNVNEGVFKDIIRKSLTSSSGTRKDSHKTFQDNFPEQLEGLPDLHVIRDTDTDVWNTDEDVTLHPCNCTEGHTTSSHGIEEERPTQVVINDRVCPICQEPFGITLTQTEFEEHVFNHLEEESNSLLENYVIL